MRACIIAGARTPIGRRAGAFAELGAKDLAAVALAAAMERSGLAPDMVDDVTMGSTLAPEGNLARVAWLSAGLPVEVAARSIDRQCGSGIDAVWLAAQSILTGAATTSVAGGAESMTNEPFQLERTARAFAPAAPKFLKRHLSTPQIGDPGMGITAENLADKYGITREDQDLFALQSQQRMVDAVAAGHLDKAIVPVLTKAGVIDRDEHPRPDTTLERLAALRPAFREDGTVTAGNASGINDGAGAVVVVSEETAREQGLRPQAWVVDGAVAGVDPNIMGIGPAPAIRKLLDRIGWHLEDVDVLEINEAFAVQVLACVRDLGLRPEQVNAWGGAIAHGHPIAATGTMLVMKAVDQLARRGGGRAIVSACIGGGEGIALAIERDTGHSDSAGWTQANR